MFHDPCNPLPSTMIPSGLPLHSRHMAGPGPGHAAPRPPQSQVITGAAPHYLGCDHRQPANHVHSNSVQAPPMVKLPAAIVPHSAVVTVATLPSVTAPVLSFTGLADDEAQMPMPEPSSTVMFLFAIAVALVARRLDLRRCTLSSLFALNVAPPVKARHRHRSRTMACYQAFQ